MAFVDNNPLLKGASGALGKNVVFKQVRGRTHMTNMPRKRKRSSEKQKEQQDVFQLAVRYAKRACSFPEWKAMYAKGINDRKHSANAVAVSDYLNPPEIHEINVLTYTGAPGELIRIRAFDDFKVASVIVTITNAEGIVIEKGEAQLRGKKGLWRMMTTVRNPSAPGTVFSVVAKDMAGNETTKAVAIPIAGMQAAANAEQAIQAGVTETHPQKEDKGEKSPAQRADVKTLKEKGASVQSQSEKPGVSPGKETQATSQRIEPGLLRTAPEDLVNVNKGEESEDSHSAYRHHASDDDGRGYWFNEPYI